YTMPQDPLSWTALNGPQGSVLPNALITQISYTPLVPLNVSRDATRVVTENRGDVLLISTFGRGNYQISNASAVLGKTNVLTIAGPAPGASVVIQPDPTNPQMIDVVVTDPNVAGGPVTTAYPAQSFSSIQ